MKAKILNSILFLLLFSNSYSQDIDLWEKHFEYGGNLPYGGVENFNELIRNNFNFKELAKHKVEEVPMGIYVATFNLDTNRIVSNFKLNIDSVKILEKLFESALQKSYKQYDVYNNFRSLTPPYNKQNFLEKHCMIFCFYNFANPKIDKTQIEFSNDLSEPMSNFLKKQYANIETTLLNISNVCENGEPLLFVGTVIITNKDWHYNPVGSL